VTQQKKPQKYIIPITGPFGPWGIAFYTHQYDDRVTCERCGRSLQWPDAAREHVRYEAHFEHERALREHARWRNRIRRWWRS
jgi:hypothetical protein